MTIILKSNYDIKMELAGFFEAKRLMKNLSRKSLEEKSGVSASVIRKFESTGDISLSSFIALCTALDSASSLELFLKDNEPAPLCMKEVKNLSRKRGRK